MTANCSCSIYGADGGGCGYGGQGEFVIVVASFMRPNVTFAVVLGEFDESSDYKNLVTTGIWRLQRSNNSGMGA